MASAAAEGGSRPRLYKRLVFKNGETNVSHCSVKNKRTRYLADFFTTLIDTKWNYAILLFVAAFACSWLVGGLVWLLMAFSRRDTDQGKADSDRCVNGVQSFVGAFLFSLETQHTIGYGSRSPNTVCPEATLFVMLQSIVGLLIQAFMTGFIFAKLTKPGKRANAIMFSREAVISKRDDQLVLLIRIGDMRRSQLIEAHIRGVLIKKRITEERECLPLEQFQVDFGSDTGRDRLFLPFPVIAEHRIDESSPFWHLSAADLCSEQFELVIILEGIAESTGNSAQARSSYLPSEIRWGYTFDKLVTYRKENGRYRIDFNKFNSVRAVANFPGLSACELEKLPALALRQFACDFGEDAFSVAESSVGAETRL